MVSGDQLARPVLLSDFEEIFELDSAFLEGQPVERNALEGRPSLRLGLFWHSPTWEPFVREGRLDELTPRAIHAEP